MSYPDKQIPVPNSFGAYDNFCIESIRQFNISFVKFNLFKL